MSGEFPMDNFPLRIMMRVKPYIELYTDFILRYFEEEYEASK